MKSNSYPKLRRIVIILCVLGLILAYAFAPGPLFYFLLVLATVLMIYDIYQVRKEPHIFSIHSLIAVFFTLNNMRIARFFHISDHRVPGLILVFVLWILFFGPILYYLDQKDWEKRQQKKGFTEPSVDSRENF